MRADVSLKMRRTLKLRFSKNIIHIYNSTIQQQSCKKILSE